jgi:hypothetical protein
MSAMITGKNYLVIKMDCYDKYLTKQYTNAHTSTLHTQLLVASTWMATIRSSDSMRQKSELDLILFNDMQ